MKLSFLSAVFLLFLVTLDDMPQCARKWAGAEYLTLLNHPHLPECLSSLIGSQSERASVTPPWCDCTQAEWVTKPCPCMSPLARLSWEVLPPGSRCKKHRPNRPEISFAIPFQADCANNLSFCQWLLHIYALVASRYGRLSHSPACIHLLSWVWTQGEIFQRHRSWNKPYCLCRGNLFYKVCWLR